MRFAVVLLSLVTLAMAGRPESEHAGGRLFPLSIGEAVSPQGTAYFPVVARSMDKLAWRFSEGQHSGFACVGRDGVIRLQGGGGYIRGVDASTGARRWIAGGNARFFNYSSCVLGRDGTSYGGNRDSVCAVDKDGKLRWRTALQASWIHRPPALSPDGKTIFVGGDALGIAALDVADGTVRWLRKDFQSPWSKYVFDHSGRLIVGVKDRVVCFEPNGGAERWTLPIRATKMMVVAHRLIVAIGNKIACYDLATRKREWETKLGSRVNGLALSDDSRVRATLKNGHLVALSLEGRLHWDSAVSKTSLHRPTTTRGGVTLVSDKGGMLYRITADGKTAQSIQVRAPWRWRPMLGPDGSIYVNDRDGVQKVTGKKLLPARHPVATKMTVVADDFVVNVWKNGEKVPDRNRVLLLEIHGASTECVHTDLRPGDWVVFHVVANRLRWGGSAYLGVFGVDSQGLQAFVSTTKGNWSACDDIAKAKRFVLERDFGADILASKPAKPWEGAAPIWKKQIGRDFPGEAVWGKKSSTWIKFIVPSGR
jgi:outer membrane protein assembly factor BamB